METENKLSILSMIYPGIKAMDFNRLFYIENRKLIIIDYDGNTILEKDRVANIESNRAFISFTEFGDYKTNLYCAIDDSIVECSAHTIGDNLAFIDYCNLSKEYINTYNYSSLFGQRFIVNPTKKILGRVYNSRGVYLNKKDSNYEYYGYYNTLTYTNDTLKIKNDYSAVEYFFKSEFCVGPNGKVYYKAATEDTREQEIDYLYKLYDDFGALTEKGYKDILKIPGALGEYFKTESTNGLEGIIRNDGVEIIPTLYNSIEYIGNGTFLLCYNKNEYYIYNISLGILNNISIQFAKLHYSLPIIIVNTKENQVLCVNSNCNIFEPKDIVKFFDCSYSEIDTNIIRISIGSIYKYIDNTLNPITNLKKISSVANGKWVKM